VKESYYVSGNSLKRCLESDEAIRDDPRGVLHVWEEPKSHARYTLSCDPTVGHTGWSRFARVDGDDKTDNCAIEIFQVDALKIPLLKDGKPEIDERTKQPKMRYQDLQVAEFFAPIDAVEAGRVLNLLGKIYQGDAEDQCLLIFESQPGPGILTCQELLRLGYSNLWYWETIAGDIAEPTSHIGWRSWRESQKLLWMRARRHLLEDSAFINSPWLLAEYSNAVVDINTQRAQAAYGLHDDLMQAASMNFWASHAWHYDPDRPKDEVTDKPIVEAQTFAPTLGDSRHYREQWADAVDAWE